MNEQGGETELFSDGDIDEPGPSHRTNHRDPSPELFTDSDEVAVDGDEPTHSRGDTVDGGDTVDAPMIIDHDEPGPSKPPADGVDWDLINRWIYEGTSQEPEDMKRRRGVIAGRSDEKNELRSFGHYMKMKRDKLKHQINGVGKAKQVSEIFKGISIFVNGYTDPPALELRHLIQAHGGEYHVYFEYGTTTYTVASEMAQAKRSKVRKNEVILKPEFIVDSIAAGRLLDHKAYLLIPDEMEMRRRKGATISQAMRNLTEKAADAEKGAGKRQVALDARNADFIDEYYARSRLHLISTLAQEMRDYVTSLRDSNASTDEARAVMNERLGERREEGTPTRRLPPSEKAVFHIDLDCFFVSVTLRTREELRGKPVAVTHSSGSKDSNGFSEIASCSYEARARGVRNGSLVRDALRKCTNLVCVPYQFDDYRSVSKMIYDIIASHTLELRAVSCDEMYVDVSSLIRSFEGFGSEGVVDGRCIGPIVVANYLRELIRESTGCPASVGIGPNPLIARLATRLAKPDGVKWVQQREVDEFISKQKVADLPGVGHSTLAKLGEFGGAEMKCGELRLVGEMELERVMGKKTAHHLHSMAHGIDEADVVIEQVRKSVSCDINYGIRFTKDEELHQFLASLAAQLEKKLLQARMKAGAMTLKVMVRAADAPVETAKYLGHGRCDTHTRVGRLNPVCGDAGKMVKEARSLMTSIKAPVEDLRGIGITLNRLVPSNSAARPLASELNRFFAPRKGCGVIDRIEQMKKKETEKEAAKKRTRPVWEEEEVENYRRPIGDFMVKDIVVPDGLHAPSKIRTLDMPEKLMFMGETKPDPVRLKILEIMLETPAPPLYGPILQHGWALVQRGELLELRRFARATIRTSESQDAAAGWQFTTRLIVREWEAACGRRYGAMTDLLDREERSEWNEVLVGREKEEEKEKKNKIMIDPRVLFRFGLRK